MRVEIDPYAGFCFGVKRAIELAEKSLDSDGNLYCLGEIVHNEVEINRLQTNGLRTIDHGQLESSKGNKILIRAHGEPPSTYEIAKKNKLEIIEGTCPVVISLQKKVIRAWNEISALNGQVVICGKADHPEIISLKGQINGQARIIEKESDLDGLNYNHPIRLFAQTTFNDALYERIIEGINRRIGEQKNDPAFFRANKSICHQVTNRIPKLIDFCKQHDVMIFVSGRNSSNGKFLFNLCKENNQASYTVSAPEELNEEWYSNAESVGISGATSTPAWLLEKFLTVIQGD